MALNRTSKDGLTKLVTTQSGEIAVYTKQTDDFAQTYWRQVLTVKNPAMITLLTELDEEVKNAQGQ